MGQKLNGPLIKALRQVAGQRQEDLAALAGISERSVRAAEAGKAKGVDVCTRLAKALRVDPPDQLFAEKELTLEKVRFVGQKAEQPKIAAEAENGLRPAEGIGRVLLNLQQRKQLRLYVLDSVTPKSGLTLARFGVCFHEEESKHWPQTTFEGFLSACLYYLKKSIRPVDNDWSGNDHAVNNSTLMGRHLARVWGTGADDDKDIPKADVAIRKFEKMWAEAGMEPIDVASESLHKFCPVFEPNSFYHGWRELSLWLTANGLTRDEEGPVDSYMKIVLQMMVTYLNKFEHKEQVGNESFWTMVDFFLRKEYGEAFGEHRAQMFKDVHSYSMEEFWEGMRFALEFTDAVKAQYGAFISSYADSDTGFEAAILKLQTQFIYTGKPREDFVEIKTSRHP
jgi:transcriptional regulator with XRE-family HTH domain